MNRTSIYLVGRRRSGKDTAARALAEAFGMRVVAMTAPLYDVAERYFGMVGKDRVLLQRVGDAFRNVEIDWLTRHILREPGLVVCADVRLIREADLLRDHGWIGLRVVRPWPDRKMAIEAAGERADGPEAHHRTETETDMVPVDAEIVNDGSAEGLGRIAIDACVRVWAEREEG